MVFLERKMFGKVYKHKQNDQSGIIHSFGKSKQNDQFKKNTSFWKAYKKRTIQVCPAVKADRRRNGFPRMENVSETDKHKQNDQNS